MPTECCGCDNAATKNLDWNGETAANQPMCASCHAETARVLASPAHKAMMARVAGASLSPAATAMLLRAASLLEDCTGWVSVGELVDMTSYGACLDSHATLEELVLARPRLVDADESGVQLTGEGWAIVNALTPDLGVALEEAS